MQLDRERRLFSRCRDALVLLLNYHDLAFDQPSLYFLVLSVFVFVFAYVFVVFVFVIDFVLPLNCIIVDLLLSSSISALSASLKMKSF